MELKQLYSKVVEAYKRCLTMDDGYDPCVGCPYENDNYCGTASKQDGLILINELAEINSNLEDSVAFLKTELEYLPSHIMDEVRLYFSLRFGTYTKDDTVKIAEVFDILKEITERLTEDTNET